MSERLDKSQIAKNSILLYLRMLFTMWINLYATRLVLANLGVNDMGVYGVVGSIVSLLSVFTNSITNTVQRFLTFELGREHGETNVVFCSSLNIILILSVFVIIILETVGLWFLYHKVDIPHESISQAFWVYQFSVLTCIINLISIPYNALVIAHERMDVYAAISVIQVVMTCIVAWCLSFIDNQRLFAYAAMMTFVSILIRLFYQTYCQAKFNESHYKRLIDIKSMRQIGRFAGVTTIAGILETTYNQGVILVINWTFGVALNAVYTIALQLKNSVLSFAFNIFKAVSPQITKTYAIGDIDKHKQLVYSGSKIEVYMIYFIIIPFLFRTEQIMKLWLGEVPQYMVSYAQSIIFLSLLYALFEPIRTAVMATNNITRFMIIPNWMYIFLLPLCYIVSIMTKNAGVLIIFVIFIEVVVCTFRIYFALKVTPLRFREMATSLLVPCVLVASFNSIVCYLISDYFASNLMGLIFFVLSNIVILSCIIILLGLNRNERMFLRNIIRKKIS